MKKILRVSLTVVLVGVLFCACFVTTAAAKTTSGKIGKTITWIFDDETGTLTLSGGGCVQSEENFSEFNDEIVLPHKTSIKKIVCQKNTSFFDENIQYREYYGLYYKPDTFINLEYYIEKLPNGFSREYDIKNNTLILKGKGECPDLGLEYYERLPSQIIKIDDGITDMGSCHWNAQKLVIGKDCKNIGTTYAFDSYEVDSENPVYASYEGCLYTKDYSKLISTPHKDEVPKFHPNVSIIGNEAFRISGTVDKDIIIPWGVTTIEGSLFIGTGPSGGPTNMRIILPETLKNWNRESGGGMARTISYLFGEGSQTFKSGYYGTGVEFWPLLPKERYYSLYGITPNSLKTFQNGKTYYFDQNCKMAKGWKQASGNWYYFNDYGAAVVKIWLKSGNKWYFMQADGTMATNKWIQWYNKWYYMGSDGAMYANRWIKSSGKWYYLGSDGAMYTNRYTPDGCWVNGSGA